MVFIFSLVLYNHPPKKNIPVKKQSFFNATLRRQGGGGGVGGVYYAYETWKRRMNINNKKEKKTVTIYNEFQLNQFKFYRDIVLVKG